MRRLLLLAFVIACSSSEITEPPKPQERIFAAWSHGIVQAPFPIQTMKADVRLERQFTGLRLTDLDLTFAAKHPGRLYVQGDEPDQQCITPGDYAVSYHDWVVAIRAADSTARFSPAGLAEPNQACGPLHSTEYAEAFYDAYVAKYGEPPPVAEWRFHDFGLGMKGDIAAWWARVEKEVEWSAIHGAPMVLGSWGFLDWQEPPEEYSAHMRQAMSLIRGEPRIKQAVWWSYEQIGVPHFLMNPDGSLTSEGETYAEGAK